VKRRELGDACDDLCNAFFNRSDEIASRSDRGDIDENHLFAEMVPEICGRGQKMSKSVVPSTESRSSIRLRM